MNVLKFIITALIITSCNAQQSNNIKNDLDEINTFGKVKSLKGFIYKADESIDSKKIQVFIKFNEKGYMKEMHWYDDTNQITAKNFYEYDSVKNVNIMKRYESDTILTMKSITHFNDKGYKLKNIIYRKDGSELKTRLYKYNDIGHEIEMEYIIHYSSKDDYSRWENEYDANGYLIMAKKFNKDGSFDFKQTSKNDKDGNELEWVRYENDGTVDFRIDKQYDQYGNETKYHMYEGTIDDKESYKYIYDSKNNWIEKQHFNNSKKTVVEIREITYYE